MATDKSMSPELAKLAKQLDRAHDKAEETREDLAQTVWLTLGNHPDAAKTLKAWLERYGETEDGAVVGEALEAEREHRRVTGLFLDQHHQDAQKRQQGA